MFSDGLPRISFVRASEELFTTVVFDALEGTRDGCALRKQTRRRSLLSGPPRPATPPCPARPDPPRSPRRSSTQYSALKFEDGGKFFDFLTRRMEKEEGDSSKKGGILRRRRGSSKKRGILRRRGSSSKIGGSSKKGGGKFFVLRVRRSKTSPIFDLRTRRSKNPPSSIFDLRSRRPKTLPSSIFRGEDRRTPHLRSSELEDRRTPPPIFNPRSLEPKIEEPFPSSIFGPEEFRRSGGRRWGGVGLLPPKNKGLSHLPPFRHEERRTPPSSTFSAGRMDEDSPLVLLLPTPHGHQLPSAILRSGSSDRSSTLKTGPKIEIGFLLTRPRVSGFWTRQVDLILTLR